MKKFTLFKSVLALIAAFVMVLPTSAQVTSMADLFGTYKFTATVNVTDAGKALADNFKSECDVTITKCSYGVFDGEIQGLAGATAAQSINGIDLSANTIKITNPNGNGLWSGGLYMSNTEGVYPFGGGYSDILYTFDPATKTITLPDFTLVTCDHSAQATTIVATFTGAKLTLVASENIEVTDLSGDWHFTAGKGTYDVMEGSTLPTEFDMAVTATDNSKKNYSISMKLGEFAPLALTATFDGVTLTIPFNETYFDAENKIGLVNMYGEARPGTITFNMINESLLSLSSGMVIAQDSISPEVKGGYLQWYMTGSAKKQGGEVAAATWDGTYIVKAGSIYKQIADFTYPETFEMVVTYNADYDMYLITNFFGQDVANLNYGGIVLTPSADDPNKAEIKTGGYLQTIKGGEHYLVLKDQNFSDGTLLLTRLEDGTYTISDFCISSMTYNEDWSQKHDFAAWYQTVTATKAAAEEPVKPFNWANTFKVKAGSVDVYKTIDGVTYPTEFDMEVVYEADYDSYYVTKFLGEDVGALNYGGIKLTPSADDPNKAELAVGGFLKTIERGAQYLSMKDMNLQDNPIVLTYNGDGTVKIDNFCVSYMTYDENWQQVHAAAALYNDVTASLEGSAVEPEPKPEPFNWANTYAVKAESIDVYNNAYTYPKEFDMEVIYDEAYNEYLVTKFFGQDVTGLNYGGIILTPSADDPNKAELKTDTYLQTIEAGKTYLKMYDMNATSSPVILTANEDGSISISSFCVSVADFGTGETKAAALYNGVTATVGSTPAPIETTDVMLYYPDGVESANEIELQDGFKMAITGNTGKNISSASKITIDGEQYVSIKLSNGAQNTLTLPEGKVATAITFYSYVNKDAQTDRPAFWKEVGGTTYDIETSGGELMCFKDAENPDVRSYTLESPMSSITFTNSGEQLCFVMKVAVADGTSGIEDVTVKPAINVNAPAFNLSGQRVSKTFKGIVIMNGKKYLVK